MKPTIEEILNKYTGCKTSCECGCGLVEAMKEYGTIVRDATLDEAAKKVRFNSKTKKGRLGLYYDEYYIDKQTILDLKNSDELKIE